MSHPPSSQQQQAPGAVRHSPRTRMPQPSPNMAAADRFFTSPAFAPISAGTANSAAAASATALSGSSGGEFVHPASIAQSPLVAPIGAMSFMKSLHRPPPTSADRPTGTATPTQRSRRNSFVPSMQLADAAESKVPSASSMLRASSTSPPLPSRSMRSPHPSSSAATSGVASGYPSPSYPSLSSNSHFDSFDTPALTAMGAPASGSKSRYAHGLSRPYESGNQSPFLAPHSGSRRSPRVSHSPSTSGYSSFMSPSPGMAPSLSQSHSPTISFALPSPSLIHMQAPGGGGLGAPASSSSTRDLSGGLHSNSHNHQLNSHIFGLSWEGDSLSRRSPRLSGRGESASHRGRSPSFTMFSPPTHAHYAHGHGHGMQDMNIQGQAAAAGGHHSRPGSQSRGPSASPPLNSVPSSPNLSILGKLRSLHAADGDAMKLEGGEYAQHHHHQQQHGRGGKRNRGDYEYEAPSPSMHGRGGYSSHQQHHSHHTHHSTSASATPSVYAMAPITSPAMVGALPPSNVQSMSMADVRSPEQHYQRRVGRDRQDHEADGDEESYTPARRHTKPKAAAAAAGSVPMRAARMKSDTEGLSSPDMTGAEIPMSIAGNGSGSSCHQVSRRPLHQKLRANLRATSPLTSLTLLFVCLPQCKSRRVIADLVFCCNATRKRGDRKVSPSATSSVAHSCRKKYCGACLTKFYNERPPPKKPGGNTTWPCPACRGICCCAACRRIKAKQLDSVDPTQLSPASMLAYSFVYCPDILLTSMGDHEDLSESDTHTRTTARPP